MQVPPCPNCGGILKPEIIFFGDNVHRSIVNFVYEKVQESDAMLLLGTSLYVSIKLKYYKEKRNNNDSFFKFIFAYSSFLFKTLRIPLIFILNF